MSNTNLGLAHQQPPIFYYYCMPHQSVAKKAVPLKQTAVIVEDNVTDIDVLYWHFYY